MILVLAFLFGLLIGSFLNVCIYRLPRNRSVVTPRSYCPQCRRTIAWYDNIPVLSYLLLRGRCRWCEEPIPSRYPLVELLTGSAYALLVAGYGPNLRAVRLGILASLLIALAFTDLSRRILPDELTKGGILLGLLTSISVPPLNDIVYLVLKMSLHERVAAVISSAIGAFGPSLLIWGVAALWAKLRNLPSDALGLGDVKMIAMIGSFLGIQAGLAAMVVGSIFGSVIGVAYILLQRKDWHTFRLPYGTYIAIGTLAFVVARGLWKL